jgi:speckle-type POZ protein
MEPHGPTNLTEAVRSVQLLKIDGYCATPAIGIWDSIKSRWTVDGHEWELHLYPRHYAGYCVHWIALKLVLVSEAPQGDKSLTANLSCRLVHPSRSLHASAEKSVSYAFGRETSKNSPLLLLMRTDAEELPGYIVSDSLTVQCTITVLKRLADVVVPAEVPLPPSDLHWHLSRLLQGRRGADVTLVLDSGETFPAHKTILAARSPVFMAEFFGNNVSERSSSRVRIADMEASIFKAVLHFIYTDMAPTLDGEPVAVAAVAQQLLAASNRYALVFPPAELIVPNFIEI